MQKIKTSSLIYLAVLGVLTVFRVLQLSVWVDPLTGFTDSLFADVVLYGILALFLVFLMGYVYFDKKFKSENIPLNSNITKYVIFIYAFAVLVVSIVDFKSVSEMLLLIERNPNLLLTVVFTIITCVLGILCGVSCVVNFLVSFYKKEPFKLTFIPCFLMIVYTAFLLLYFFIKERTLVTISQNLLTLFFWMSALKFIFSYSKYVCESKIGNPFKETFVFALMTSVLGAVTTIPMLFFNGHDYYSLLKGEYILAFPVFILSTLVCVEFMKKEKFLKN